MTTGSILAIVGIVLWVSSVVGYIIYNLYNKNIKMEQSLVEQQLYIRSIRRLIPEMESIINKIDTTMWVQSDPDLHALFDNIKNLQAELNNYLPENK